ncbi:MAG: protein kinase domain-containing protein [Ktedonobacteraceae bacterium]
METGLVIGGHYLLQRLIKQGQFSTVYWGVDQLFQRNVAVKSVPAAQIPEYRAAVRMTAQFSYPNIIGLYDLVAKPDRLYLIQEYVEGDDFAALMRMQPQPHEVADIGRQICLGLLYASSSSRQICHGDLTPNAIIRDQRGLVRINNFALPSDTAYFTAWNRLGGEGIAVTDRDLPWGVMSEGRRADDTRAVGLLLYQLLTSRAPGTTSVEPPADGRLRFPRSIPPELCELIARTIIRQHPQHIDRVDMLYDELKTLTENLESAAPVLVSNSAGAQPQQADVPNAGLFAQRASGKLGNVLPGRQPGAGLAAYRNENSGKLAAVEAEPVNTAMTVADSPAPIKPVTARQVVYPPRTDATPPLQGGISPHINARQSSPLLWLLVLGLIVFSVCFVVGFFAGTTFFPH